MMVAVVCGSHCESFCVQVHMPRRSDARARRLALDLACHFLSGSAPAVGARLRADRSGFTNDRGGGPGLASSCRGQGMERGRGLST